MEGGKDEEMKGGGEMYGGIERVREGAGMELDRWSGREQNTAWEQ